MNTLTRKGILSLACILAFIMPSAAFWRDEVQALAEESLLSSSVGHAPVVQTVETETVKDVIVHIPLAATDPDGDTVTLKLIDQPRLGTAAFENGNLIYTPAAGKTGTDQFSYCAVDVMGNESEMCIRDRSSCSIRIPNFLHHSTLLVAQLRSSSRIEYIPPSHRSA